MKSSIISTCVCCLFVGVTIAFANNSVDLENDKSAKVENAGIGLTDAKAGSAEDAFEPIDNMHHFMEYISQPSYRALKKAFAGDAPKDRRGWKPIKSHALILAETSALVADRVPEGASEEEAAQWRQISLDVYNAGKALYKSAGDFEKAKSNYGLMLDSCNKCHKVFDNGKHQLAK